MNRVESELAALRGRAPVSVDVADRVMARIVTLPAPTTLPTVHARRPFVIAASLAAAVAAAAMMAMWLSSPGAIVGGLLDGLALLRGMGGSTTTVASLARSLAGALEFSGSTLRPILSALEPLRPAVTTASLTLGAVTVAGVILIVIRDVSRASVLEEI